MVVKKWSNGGGSDAFLSRGRYGVADLSAGPSDCGSTQVFDQMVKRRSDGGRNSQKWLEKNGQGRARPAISRAAAVWPGGGRQGAARAALPTI